MGGKEPRGSRQVREGWGTARARMQTGYRGTGLAWLGPNPEGF